MPQVNFYLKKANPSTGKCLIYLQFRYSSRKLVFSFNQTIDSKNWNCNKQRVKQNVAITTTDGSFQLNDLLDNLAERCLSTYYRELKTGVPIPSTIKNVLTEFLNFNSKEENMKKGIPSIYNLIDRFISGEIKFQGRNRRKNTLKVYTTSKRSLLDFEKKEKYPVNYDSINLDFFYRYVSFLQKKGLAHNTISKRIKTVKVFMNEALDLGYTENMKHKTKKFSVPEKEVDTVYLTEEEIMKLYRHDFSTCKRLEAVVDLFIFGCFTGLRISDYSNIKPENIITIDDELYLKVITVKTENLVIIPCNPIVLEIFQKYAKNANKLPKAISDQKFNQYIKEACQICGLTEKGRLLTEPEKELWEAVSSHTARRSMITNFYLQGFQMTDLMKISGHKNHAAFLRYVKVSKIDAARKLNEHMKINRSKYLLAAVG